MLKIQSDRSKYDFYAQTHEVVENIAKVSDELWAMHHSRFILFILIKHKHATPFYLGESQQKLQIEFMLLKR